MGREVYPELDEGSPFTRTKKVHLFGLFLCLYGEIGKRCSLRSRCCNYLGSSSLPVGTQTSSVRVFVCARSLNDNFM